MNTYPQTARADVVTGQKAGIVSGAGSQLKASSVRITQGVWLSPASEQIFWVGIDAAAVNSGVRMQYKAAVDGTDEASGAFSQGCFIPINDPSRVYIHAVGGSGVVGFMYV